MDLVTRLFARRNIVVPVVVGVVAVLLGSLFAFITLRGDDDTEQTSAPKVTTRSFVSEAGGYAIDVPTDLEESRQGRAATFSAKDKSLVVTVGPSEAGPLRPASRRYLRTLRAGYEEFQLLGKQDETIDGRPALAAYGQVTNENRVRIRFVA
ncbi:MAG: hypothetical protein ACRDXB_10010, partial [Actinomycetes bacterium]